MNARRGQPILVLIALLCGWVGGRAMHWENLTASATAGAMALDPLREAAGSTGNGKSALTLVRGPQSYQDEGYDALASGAAGYAVLPANRPGSVLGIPVYYRLANGAAGCGGCSAVLSSQSSPGYMAMPAREEWGESAAVFASPPHGVVSRPLHLASGAGAPAGTMAGERGEFASVQPLLGLDPQVTAPAPVTGKVADPGPTAFRPRRWSMDAWAFMRRDGDLQLANGLLPATYGANQIGSVLRFRLKPRSPLQPTLYLRADSTTGTGRYATVAAGGSLRPLAQVPVTLALEGRMLDDSAGRHYQPAALAVTQLPRFRLPHGLAGEAYAQGGWVGGRYATLFADGQARIDHGLLTLGRFETRLGAGVWGGIQKGASRLDVGPTMSLSFPLNRRVFGRASVDWRVHALGNAEPGSGPALTLSAGF